MPVRGYLSEWATETREDGGTLSWPKIALPPDGPVMNEPWFVVNLRTAEERANLGGWALVLVDVTPPQHNTIMQVPNTHEVTLQTTVEEVRAVIGEEGTDVLLDPQTEEDIVEWFRSVHANRTQRYKASR